MARVVYGSIVQELIGSVGAGTFQQNTSGSILRQKSSNVKKTSLLLNDSKSTFSTVLNHWKTLSQSDRESWSTFAATYDYISQYNVTEKLTGFQYFISCNINTLLYNNQLLSTAPVFTAISNFPAFTLSIAANNIYLNAASFDDAGSTKIIIDATAPMRSVTPQNRRNFLQVMSLSPSAISQIDIGYAHYMKFTYMTWYAILAGVCSIAVRARFVDYLTGLSGINYSSVVKLKVL
jgi:hypothetical protein